MTTEIPFAQKGDALRLLFAFSEAIARQHKALLTRDWVELQQSLRELQQAMQEIGSFPGGSDGVRKQLSQIQGQERETADRLIEKVVTERRASSELIRLHLQRLQVLQVMSSMESDVETYGASVASKGAGGRLSTWV